MRKPVVPRFLFLLALYALIFIFLVWFQFAKKDNFTHRAGDLVIQGRYGELPENTGPSGSYPLTGDISVFFGGMEFILGQNAVLSGPAGGVPALPRRMTVTDNGVYFELAEGPQLVFMTQYTGGAIELLIRVDFSAPESGYTSLELPCKALATSMVQESPFLLNAGGVNYAFNRSVRGGSLLLEAENPVISYRARPDRQNASPGDFIIPAALETEAYEEALALWLDQSYSEWNRALSQNTGAAVPPEEREEMISAYMSEALKRGTYRAAAAAAAPSSNPSSYEASAYVGRLDTALRALAGAERERSARFARLFNERNTDFLKEFHIIEYLGVRSYANLMDDAAEMLRTFDPAQMSAGQTAGFLEGQSDWKLFRPGSFNPYDRFIDQALYVITGSLRKDVRTGNALVFSGEEEADTELNLRLGRALLEYGETEAALGRTLILSVLSLADNSGAVPRKVIRSGGAFTGQDFLGSPEIYRICFAGENYARAQALGAGLWAWTAATSASASGASGRTDIGISFPPGETHYMMIRGVRPFRTLQINGINVPQESQFERYDSSGWTYSAAEQTLLLKIRHRSPTERIGIVY